MESFVPPEEVTESARALALLFRTEKILIRDKLAYPGSLSASLSQELIAAYPWLAYPVAYPVAASRRCGQRLGGGRRLAGRRRLGGGGASEPAAA